MPIRRATLQDVPTIVRLNRTVQRLHAEAMPQLFRNDAAEAEIEAGLRGLMEDPQALWLLAEQPGPVGYLYATYRDRASSWFRPAHRICNVSHLSVEPSHQRSGIGRALLQRLAEEARSRGYTRIELDVWTFNAGAMRAFERLGFRPFNVRMEYAPDPRSTARAP